MREFAILVTYLVSSPFLLNGEIAFLCIVGLLLFHTWLGYPLLLAFFRSILRQQHNCGERVPLFTIILAAYNEEKRIAAKLENCLALEYPHDHVEIIVASDGSTDETERIVQEFSDRDSRVRLIRSSGRAGKSGVQNLAVENALGEILLFTDAETVASPDLLTRVAQHFADGRVGMVAPVVHFGRLGTSVSEGQGAYWRFELFLRQLESDLGILATCSGSAFGIRRELFRPIPRQFGDDCVVPLDIRLQGFRIVQDPQIVVYDEMPHSIDGELRARVRMTARNLAGIFSRPQALNPLRFPATALGLVSHKFLRWLTPVFLGLMYIASCTLAFEHRFLLFFSLQTCFYTAALVGWRRSQARSCGRIFGYPFAFCLANVGFLLGLVRWLRRQHVVAYK